MLSNFDRAGCMRNRLDRIGRWMGLALCGLAMAAGAAELPVAALIPTSALQLKTLFAYVAADSAPARIRLNNLGARVAEIVQITKTLGQNGSFPDEASRQRMLALARNGELGGYVQMDVGRGPLALLNLQRDLVPALSWSPGATHIGATGLGQPQSGETVVAALHTHPELGSSSQPSAPDLLNAARRAADFARYPNWLGEFVFHEGSGTMSWRIPNAYLDARRKARGEACAVNAARIAFCRTWHYSEGVSGPTMAERSARESALRADPLCAAWASEYSGFSYYETARDTTQFERVDADAAGAVRGGSALAILSGPLDDQGADLPDARATGNPPIFSSAQQ